MKFKKMSKVALSTKMKVRVYFRMALLGCLFLYFAPSLSTIHPKGTNDMSIRHLQTRALNAANSSSDNTFCCKSPTTEADVKDWHACCSSTTTGYIATDKCTKGGTTDVCYDEVMSGGPYFECISNWYKNPIVLDEACVGNSLTTACLELKKKCSDMSSYPSMGGVNGFGPGVILYIILLFYMFTGLAVICDEYFVPSLEVLAEKLDVSDDVAGATLMAAGGSAPELFTSIIGVFIARSDVGFSTIVGSAVFNVLFVIGMCAFFAKEILVLTGWPITRDSIYYSITLLLLAMFYEFNIFGESCEMKSGKTPAKCITAIEAIVQFLLYAGYVLLMSKNEKLKVKFASCKKKAAYRMSKVQASMHDMTDKITHHDDKGHSSKDRHDNKDLESVHGGNAGLSFRNRRKKDARTRTSVRFRAGILDILMGEKDAIDKMRVQSVSGFLGDCKETFDQFDTNKNGNIDASALGNVLEKLLNAKPSDDEVARILKSMVTNTDTGGAEEVTFAEFEKWYKDSELRVDAERDRIFAEIDTKKLGYLAEAEFRDVMKKLHVKERDLTDDEIAHGLELFGGHEGKITKEDFDEWYKHNVLHTHLLSEEQKSAHDDEMQKHDELEDHEDPEEGVSLAMPEGTCNRIVWALLLPLNGLLYFTVPDVRWGGGWEKTYMVSFFGSIAWIGAYSYFMVWSATITGDLLGIPQPVMGLTILAAGTSVPDLISSVIVARQGHGDMAVSSSIGSNIFDVTVGLPSPWLLALAVFGEPVALANDGTLFLSLLILLLMLASVIGVIIYSKFRMTKSLGMAMFALYVVFVIQDLLRVYKVV